MNIKYTSLVALILMILVIVFHLMNISGDAEFWLMAVSIILLAVSDLTGW